MAASVSYAIQQEVQKLLQAAGLPGIATDRIEIRQLPKVAGEIDKLPCVRISPFGNIESVQISMEGQVDRMYSIEVTLIDDNGGDAETDQDKYQAWHETVLDTIQKTGGDVRTTLSGVPSVWMIEIVEAPTFDRTKLADNFSYQGIVAKFHSLE